MEHLVVVDGYYGRLEPTVPSYDDGSAIGLPVASLVDLFRCEATVLRWDAWYAYEHAPAAFTSWESVSPHTRLTRTPPACSRSIEFNSPLIRTQSIAACDPERRMPCICRAIGSASCSTASTYASTSGRTSRSDFRYRARSGSSAVRRCTRTLAASNAGALVETTCSSISERWVRARAIAASSGQSRR